VRHAVSGLTGKNGWRKKQGLTQNRFSPGWSP